MKTFKELRDECSSVDEDWTSFKNRMSTAFQKGAERRTAIVNKFKNAPERFSSIAKSYSKALDTVQQKTSPETSSAKPAAPVVSVKPKDTGERSVSKVPGGEVYFPKSSTSSSSSAKPAAPVPAPKPIQKAEPVATMPAVNVTANRPKEVDPNASGGFVTATASRGPSGELRTSNLARGTVDATSLPHKTSGLSEPLQKAKNVSYAKPQDIKPATSASTVGTQLPPQGSAERDEKLKSMGYKKF